MKFIIMDEQGFYPEREVEINTLAELSAFAQGKWGRIEIDYNAMDYDGEKLRSPVIHAIKYLHWEDEKC